MSAEEEPGPAAAMETEQASEGGEDAEMGEAPEQMAGGEEADGGEGPGDGHEEAAGSDAELNAAAGEPEDEDAVFAQRDRLEKLMHEEPADLTAACAILDALMDKWDNIEPAQIVLGRERSLGMMVRRLRKHAHEELATRAGRLFDLYQSEVRSEYDIILERYRKQRARDKEKSERKKALSSMSNEKKKNSAEKTSERKQKREKKRAEGEEKQKAKRAKKKKRKHSSDEDAVSEPEPEDEQEEEEGGEEAAPSPKKAKKEKKAGKEKKDKGKRESKKKQRSKAVGDDEAYAEATKEATPEPDESDVPARIGFLLHKMIKGADLNTITSRTCKDHIRASFADGDAVLEEHKVLIKERINHEIQMRAH